ncbi:MAG: DNA polymerase I, partial [Verrucomicrobia bacterium]|nr:DNA polymerase I [Verrucomicrobiota bacterium]
DGHAYAYRSFFAIRSLNAPDGAPTNAIFGFIKTLLKIRGALQPAHGAVVWDGGLAAERVAALPGYKAQRPEMPSDLEKQLDGLVAWLRAAGMASLCRDGVEADDWLAGLARRAAEAGRRVVLASSDKDFMQLVSPQIGLLNPNDKSETVWTREQVVAKTGVEPEQIVDWLALVGDSVDNIPGVPGVGPKTAADLLRQFHSVEAIYRRLDEVKSDRLRGALAESRAAVLRNQQLVRLREDVAGAFALEEFAFRAPDVDALVALYGRWGFKSLRQELESARAVQGELL